MMTGLGKCYNFLMENIKGVIFDWDGVIVDSMTYIARGIKETAASFGVNVSVEDVVKNYIQPKEAYYESIGVDISNSAELTKRHLDFIKKNENPTFLYKEIVEVLEFLKSKNLKLSVASSADRDFILKEIQRLGLNEFFEEGLIPGGEPPKPAKLSKIIELFKLPPNELLYVGDLPTDMIVGRNAGMKVFAVGRDEFAYQRLTKTNPDFISESLDGLR